jgi:asparagine synthase (glutamine-hydrolysing)
VRNVDGFPWAQNTLDRVSLLNPSVQNHAGELVQDQYQTTVSQCDILPTVSPLERRMKEMVNLNFRWFMQTLLDRKDRMSMYHGLEVRVPFCDHRIAEYMYSVPWEMKDLQGREKGLLRKAMEGLLPEQVLYRKKSPYPKTHHPEYEALIYDRLKQVLDCQDAPVWQLLSRQSVVKYFEKPTQWPWYGQLMGRPQTMAYFLQIHFWPERYKIQMNW